MKPQAKSWMERNMNTTKALRKVSLVEVHRARGCCLIERYARSHWVSWILLRNFVSIQRQQQYSNQQ